MLDLFRFFFFFIFRWVGVHDGGRDSGAEAPKEEGMKCRFFISSVSMYTANGTRRSGTGMTAAITPKPWSLFLWNFEEKILSREDRASQANTLTLDKSRISHESCKNGARMVFCIASRRAGQIRRAAQETQKRENSNHRGYQSDGTHRPSRARAIHDTQIHIQYRTRESHAITPLLRT